MQPNKPNAAAAHIGAADLASMAATFYNTLRDQLGGPNADNAAMMLTGTYIQTALQIGAMVANQRNAAPAAQLDPSTVAELVRRAMGAKS